MLEKEQKQTELLIQLGNLLDKKTIYVNGLQAQNILAEVKRLQGDISIEEYKYHMKIKHYIKR